MARKRPALEIPPDLLERATMKQIALPPGVSAGTGPTKRKRKPPAPFPIVMDPAKSHGGGYWAFTIDDWHPTKLNALMSMPWPVRRKAKFGDAVRIADACRKAGVTGAIGPRALSVLILLGPGQRGADPDAYDKGLRDGLKRCGAIKDDNRQWLVPRPVLFERVPRLGTAIILEDL